MKSTKVYTILSSLNVYELNKFKKYINSAYFNVNKKLSGLFEFIEKDLKTEKSKELDKEEIYKQLFDTNEYNDLKFRKLNSDLLKLVEGFLALQIYESNPLHQANYLLESISKRRLLKLYNTTINSARRLSNQQLEKTASYYFYQFQIEKNLFNLTTHFEKFTKSKQKLSGVNIREIVNNLDIFFLTEKLRYYCSFLSWQNVGKLDAKLLFIDEVINHIESIEYNSIPPLAIYYQIYLTISEPDNKRHYFELKDLVSKHIESFPIDEAKDIVESLFNYCIKKINKGMSEFNEELLDLYQYSLEKQYIYVDGELSPNTYRNICLIALRLGKFEWTQNFIEEFNVKINEKHRENAYTFSLAQLNFYKKDYNKVISLLQNVEYEDVYYNLNAKTMLLAVYYEIDELNALDSLIDSFKALVSRKKSVPAQRRSHYMNLLRFTSKLSRIPPRDKIALQKLKETITGTQGVVNKNWLLTKIKELE